MFRTLCAFLGMGLVVHCFVGPPFAAAESDHTAQLPAYSYTVPGFPPQDGPARSPSLRDADKEKARNTVPASLPTLVGPKNMETLLKPSDSFRSASSVPSEAEFARNYLDIEVSHSQHVFKLYANGAGGNRDVLYECRVGLGASDFPTPVGTYYVTHIYDDDPWWIPPKDRSWAAGDVPSRKVYGGTMAPLLKKRPMKQKRQPQPSPEQEDLIAYEVQLDDYGYRFHGTNAPRSIGHNRSHGCVRMLPADARQVANLIKDQVGTVERKESENGSFVTLKAPVRLNLVK